MNEKRKYRKKKRAEQEAETRQRIVDALVELHGSVGPARTTVSEISERAGVQRATVYRHFPDEASMFAACSSHWAAQHPFPDLARWAAIAEPQRRLSAALDDLYAFYERNERMLDNTTRDAPRVAALAPSMRIVDDYLRAARRMLEQGRSRREAAGRLSSAALGHALAFATWRSLVRDQGLDREQAVELMTKMVGGVG